MVGFEVNGFHLQPPLLERKLFVLCWKQIDARMLPLELVAFELASHRRVASMTHRPTIPWFRLCWHSLRQQPSRPFQNWRTEHGCRKEAWLIHSLPYLVNHS